MLFKPITQLEPSFCGGLDQMNAPARGRRLEPQGTIGRALIQTKPAMDALVQFRDIQTRKFGRDGIL